jgi:hypothetical protein
MGRSSVTAGAEPAASLNVVAAPTKVPTISRGCARSRRARSARTAGAWSSACRKWSGSISIRGADVPTSSSSACVPDSSTACGNTSRKARTIARLLSVGT